MSDSTAYPLSENISAISLEEVGLLDGHEVDEKVKRGTLGVRTGQRQLTDEVVQCVMDALDDKKGIEVVALNVREIHSLIDVIVIATGTSPRHVRSLVEGVVDAVREDLDWRPRSVEGLEEATWVLIDFSGVTVNVFSEEARSFFSLERLWSDAPLVGHQVDLAGVLDQETLTRG